MNPGHGNPAPGPQYPHGPHQGPPVYPAAPPPRRRGKGCLYAVVGGVAALFLMGACGVIVSSASDPAATSSEAGTGTDANAGAGAGGEGADDAKPEKKKEKVTNGIGREYRDGKFAFTVTKVQKGVARVGNEYAGSEAQGQFVLVHITVENIGDEARMFDGTNQTLVDTKGREFQADTEAAIWSNEETKSFLEQINPGNSVKGVVIFDVPKNVKLKAIELHDSMFSGGVTVPLGGR
ncbi:DUF4352 domain-containing protein [Actinomadura algeriensis]|uniref:DUF4352 domain-containing protein n=1 Tax=Actinomadura algeriensis TaxID=1679523 RepID=A0ABR9K3C2_9ACTN|nr:DUF4352 domain-containing protein [Actinomadura algeriensis]MBE1537351.1 hypothetical protein [Actinomadura algeriensis]